MAFEELFDNNSQNIRNRFADVTGFKSTDTAPEGVFWKGLDYINRASYGLNEAVKHGVRGENIATGFKEGLLGEERTSGSDVLAELGFRPTSTAGKVARGVIGFGADVLTDPLNFILPVGAIGKGATKVGKLAKKGIDVLEGSGKIGKGIVSGGLKAKQSISSLKDLGVVKEFRRAFDTGFRDLGSADDVVKFNNIVKAKEEAVKLAKFNIDKSISSINQMTKNISSAKNIPFDSILPKVTDALESGGTTGIKELDSLIQPVRKFGEDIAEYDRLAGIVDYHEIDNYVTRILSKEAQEKLTNLGFNPDDILRGNIPNVARRRSLRSRKELEEYARTVGFLSKSTGRLETIENLFEPNITKALYKRAGRTIKGVEHGKFGADIATEFGTKKADFFKNFTDFEPEEFSKVIDDVSTANSRDIRDLLGSEKVINDVGLISNKVREGSLKAGETVEEFRKLQAKYAGKTEFSQYINGVKKNIKQAMENRAGVTELRTDRMFAGIDNSPLRRTLDGNYFPKDIAGEFERAWGAYDPRNAGKIVKAYDKMLNLFKHTTLAYFPQYYTRNIATNVMLMHQAGMNPVDMVQYGGDAIRYMRWIAQGKPSKINMGSMGDIASSFGKANEAKMLQTFNDIEEVLIKKGIVGDGFTREVMADAFDDAGDSKGFLAKMYRGEKKVAGKLLDKGGRIPEEHARITLFLNKRNQYLKQSTKEKLAGGKGMSIDQINDMASADVKKHLFDYSDLTDFERKVMKRVFPFYTFYRKNIPLQLEKAVKDPQRFGIIEKIRNNLSEDIPAGERDALPKWISEGVPVKLNDNLYITLRDYLPQTGLTNFGASESLNMVTPAISTIWEIANNYNAFYKQPIVDKNRKLQADFLGGLIQDENVAHGLSKIRGIKLINDVIVDYGRRHSDDTQEQKKAKPYIHSVIKGLTGANIKELDMNKARATSIYMTKQSIIATKRLIQKARRQGDESGVKAGEKLLMESRKTLNNLFSFRPVANK